LTAINAEPAELVERDTPARNLRVIRRRVTLMLVTVAARVWLRRTSVPGYAGALAVAAAIGGIVDYALPGLGWWVFCLCAGVALLIVDHRMP